MVRCTYLVEMGSQPAELEKRVLLELARQLQVVEVVEAVDRVPQRLVVLLLNEQVVVGIVDGFDVELQRAKSVVGTAYSGRKTYVLDGDEI